MSRRRWQLTAPADSMALAAADVDGVGSRPASEALRFGMLLAKQEDYRCRCLSREGKCG